MKNKRTLIIMLAALVLLSAVYGALRLRGRDNDDDKHYVVPLESPRSVASIDVGFGGNRYRLTLEDGLWYLDDDRTFPVDQQKAMRMADGLLSVFADREIEPVSELSDYGLDPAACSITAWDDEGKEFTYELGDLSDYANLYYMRYGANNKLYLTDSTLPKLFLRSRQDMIEMERLPDIYKTEVTAIVIKRGGETMEVERSGEWDEKCSEIISSFTGLYFYACVDFGVSGGRLAEYGLDDPTEAELRYVKTETRYTGKVDDDGNDLSEKIEVEYDTALLFGRDTADGYTYVMPKGSDRVYIASRSESHIVMDADLKG